MLNYYQVLGVAHTATPQVIKIAYEGKLKALGKADLSETELKNEQRLLEQAYVTLSNPAKRSWHDKQLAAEDERAVILVQRRNRTGWIAAAFLAILVIVGGSYYSVNRGIERERLRLEEQRIANARARDEARAQAEEERVRADKAAFEYRQKADADRNYARDRAYMDRQARSHRDSAYREQVRERTLSTWDRREQNSQENRERYLAEAEHRKAQQEVERQKRFVAEREREEERIRNERHYRVQRENEAARAREVADTERGLVPSRQKIIRPGYPP